MTVFRGLAILVALAMLAVVPAASHASEPTPTVSMVIPRSDSPGALANGIVTVWNVPAGYDADLVIQGLDGPSATCPRGPWANSAAQSVSRVCYVQLPQALGTYSIQGVATLTRSGFPTILVESAPRAITAKGAPSPVPMTLEHVDEIDHCGNQTDDVWLTFDDSLNSKRLTAVMAILRHNNVRARFFMTGKWLKKHPQNRLLMIDNGHLMANHSYSHISLTTATDTEVLRQIDLGVPATTDPKLLRPPYGSGAYSTRLEDLAESRGYVLCRWTTDTYDWDNESVATILDRISVGDYRSPPVTVGGVILMHGHGEHTIEALQGIIDTIRAKGLTLDPLGPATTVRRPDALVSLTSSGPYAVDDLYHHIAIKDQTRLRTHVSRKTSYSYSVLAQNDGNAVDDLLVQATEAGSGKLKITYWDGATDVSAAVRGSGYVLSSVAPGDSRELNVRVFVGRRARLGSERSSVITVRSANLPTRFDVVRVVTRR